MKTRTRLLTVRVTEAEYAQLRVQCELAGARSLADYTRHHLMRDIVLPGEAAPHVALGRDLNTIVHRLGQLRCAMRDLQSHIDRVCGCSDKASDSSCELNTHAADQRQ